MSLPVSKSSEIPMDCRANLELKTKALSWNEIDSSFAAYPHKTPLSASANFDQTELRSNCSLKSLPREMKPLGVAGLIVVFRSNSFAKQTASTFWLITLLFDQCSIRVPLQLPRPIRPSVINGTCSEPWSTFETTQLTTAQNSGVHWIV